MLFCFQELCCIQPSKLLFPARRQSFNDFTAKCPKVISYLLTYSDSLLIGCLSTVLELQKGAVENYVQRDYFLERIYLSYYSFLFSSGSERQIQGLGVTPMVRQFGRDLLQESERWLPA